MKGIFKKVLSLLLVISMLMGMMTTVVYSIEEKTVIEKEDAFNLDIFISYY